MRTSIVILFTFCFLGSTLKGQSPGHGDCEGAIPLISNVYDMPIYSHYSQNDSLEINGSLSCIVSGESNGCWFEFLVLDSGLLSFNIEAYNVNDDYDWALYNLTNASCSDIRTIDSLEVRCNYSAVTDGYGITGANGDWQAQNEPTLQVFPGDFFKLYLHNYSPSMNGFRLDFGASSFTFNSILGYSGQQLDQLIKVGPNPTFGKVNLDIDKNLLDDISSIRIIDIYGKVIIEKDYDFDSVSSFDISNEAPGLYFVQVATRNEYLNLKLILQ